MMTERIKKWLNAYETEDVLDKDAFEKGASMLLQCNNNRFMYNFLMKNYRSAVHVNKLKYELKKHLKIRLSDITLKEIEEMKPKVDAITEEVEANTEIETGSPQNAFINARFKGKRTDHDSLPKHIQVLYEQTLTTLRKERQLTERLRLLESAPPCDRHEYTTQLVELDTKRHEYWETYDHFDLEQYNLQQQEHNKQIESCEDPKKIAKTISTCRSYISSNLTKLQKLSAKSSDKAKFEDLKKNIQIRYNDAKKLGVVFTDEYLERLSSLGIDV